mmetsp:Transcript_21278/g.69424  ORF Transcript_21278/g.69424 Transcript_21278/m.69424 type:complete len:259 (+) Transcript_21278:415-1191(+)
MCRSASSSRAASRSAAARRCISSCAAAATARAPEAARSAGPEALPFCGRTSALPLAAPAASSGQRRHCTASSTLERPSDSSPPRPPAGEVAPREAAASGASCSMSAEPAAESISTISPPCSSANSKHASGCVGGASPGAPPQSPSNSSTNSDSSSALGRSLPHRPVTRAHPLSPAAAAGARGQQQRTWKCRGKWCAGRGPSHIAWHVMGVRRLWGRHVSPRRCAGASHIIVYLPPTLMVPASSICADSEPATCSREPP